MKTAKVLSYFGSFLLVMTLGLTSIDVKAQTKSETKKVMMKDCCMMKGGKMMHVKNGKVTAMHKAMTMKNGTKCMTNGECVMKNGTKMKMKEGECMDMNGRMAKSQKELNEMTEIEDEKMESMAMYSCPMHPEVTSNKSGKCSKCGMALVKKK